MIKTTPSSPAKNNEIKRTGSRDGGELIKKSDIKKKNWKIVQVKKFG